MLLSSGFTGASITTIFVISSLPLWTLFLRNCELFIEIISQFFYQQTEAHRRGWIFFSTLSAIFLFRKVALKKDSLLDLFLQMFGRKMLLFISSIPGRWGHSQGSWVWLRHLGLHVPSFCSNWGAVFYCHLTVLWGQAVPGDGTQGISLNPWRLLFLYIL